MTLSFPTTSLLVLLLSVCLCSAHDQKEQAVYCVGSNDTANTTCQSLQEYMKHSSSYFQNDTTFLFQPGEYLTDPHVFLEVRNVSRLFLKGHNATIQCNHQNNTFMFEYVNDLVIEGLEFVHCGCSSTTPNETIHNETVVCPTLWAKNVTNISLQYVTIDESDYQGILFDDVFGDILINHTIIKKCNLSRYSETRQDPANAIYFSYCADNASLVVTNTAFVSNSNPGSKGFIPYNNIVDPFAAGLTVVIKCPTVKVIMDNVTADGNHGGDGGNLAFIFHMSKLYSTLPVIVQNCNVKNGKANEGGGIYVSVVQPTIPTEKIPSDYPYTIRNHTILSIRNCHFENNSAAFVGGAIGIRQKESNTTIYIGSIEIQDCFFVGNSLKNAGHGGIAINSLNFIVTETTQHVSPQFRTFLINSTFYGNFVQHNKRKSAGSSVVFIKTNPHFQLQDVTLHSNNASAILGLQSNLVLGGNITISNNTAESGGGILLCQNAILYLKDGLRMHIRDNHANHAGGGIAVEAICVVSKPICFFQLASPDSKDYSNIQISIHNNSADHAGYNLYGGSVDFCYIIESSAHDSPANNSLSVFQEIFDIYPEGAGLPYVTSQPNHACICFNGTPDCNVTNYQLHKSVYPGEEFELEVVLAGQLDGSVPGFLDAKVYSKTGGVFIPDGAKKLKNATCKTKRFYLQSKMTNTSVVIDIGAVQQGDTSVTEYLQQYRQLKVNVLISDCPKGFVLDNQYNTCECEQIFKRAISVCHRKNHTIVVKLNTWIGTDQHGHYLVINYCPIAYCNPGNAYINTSLTEFDQDSQCQANRQGIMCGECKSNYSITLGRGDCTKCSNIWLITVPVYFVIGILLVFVLTFFDITVADGIINGFIFYANVIEVNYHAFFIPTFKHGWFSAVLSVFVGWLSFDAGVDKCLYNGMTAFQSTWIQFVFPFYVWLVLGVIVLLSRKFSTVTRLIGRNAVKVFATIILLSYSKVIRTIIDGLDHSTVYQSDNTTYFVWTNDGNVPYLHGKHIALFVFCLCLTIVCVPFTASLLFVSLLERYSHKRIFYYAQKLKPFFDAYTGPLTDKARFWTGFLLFIRFLIFITATFRGRVIAGANLSIGIGLILIVFSTAFFVGQGVYKKRSVQVLQGTLLLNLALLFMCTQYLLVHDRQQQNQKFYTYIFIGISFLMFLGVLLYYILRKIYSVKRIQDCVLSFKERVTLRFRYKRISSHDNGESSLVHRAATFMPAIARFDEEREPLLNNC